MNPSEPFLALSPSWKRIASAKTAGVPFALLAIGLVVTGIAWLSSSREYFGYSTETDFLAGFLVDATAFLNGQPLHVEYHPPLYSICIALLRTLTGDWFTTGRLLSLISAACVLVTSFFFYRLSVSRAAGWGAIAGLSISPVFIAYSAYATSDIFFLALYSAVLLLALLSEQRASTSLWFCTGIVLALALLTRSNALSLTLVATVPLLATAQKWRTRITGFGALIAGAFVPITIWVTYATVSNSNLWPAEGTTTNLALTYFRPAKGMTWADSVAFAHSNFSSIWDVLTYDPAQMLKTYVKDLYYVCEKILWSDDLFPFPAICFVLPALLYCFPLKQSRWLYYIILLTLAQVILLNFKGYQPRFYLFILPVAGALTTEFIREIYWRDEAHKTSRVLLISRRSIVAILFAIGLAQSAVDAKTAVLSDEPELSESIPVARENMNSNSTVLARKPVLSYYTGAKDVFMPPGETINDLLNRAAELRATQVGDNKDVYIYYGQKELQFRPEYKTLLDPSTLTTDYAELELIAQGQGGGQDPWVLYRYKKDN